jgi:hypothetical protein
MNTIVDDLEPAYVEPLPEPAPDRQPGRRRRHRQMLLAAAAVVVLALLLRVLPDGRVAFRFAPSVPLPETCGSRLLFGVPCPGCGLTRSIICLSRGDLAQSLAFHRLGWLLALVILYQFPYRLYCLLWRDCSPAVLALYRYFGYLLIALLVLNWVRTVCLPGL